MTPENDRSAIEDVMLLSLYMQVSRFLCWHRVRVQGDKGLEFPMIYAFNFSPSGAYKDTVLHSLRKVIEVPLTAQSLIKTKNFNHQTEIFNAGLEDLKGEAKKQYIVENRVNKFKNTFEQGTSVGLQKHRKASEVAGIGYIHYEQSEFGDRYGARESNVDDILSIAKTAWDHGDSKTNTIAGEWRDDVEGVPMTFLLHGSAKALETDDNILRRFKSILETGIGKRAFILFNKEYKRVNRTYEEKCADEELVANSKDSIEKHFQRVYNAIEVKEDFIHKNTYEYKTIGVAEEVKILKNNYRNECNGKAERTANEIIQIETRDRFWRAFRLATCIAVLEHPEDLTVQKKDYQFAMILTERWGDQFKSFLTNDKKDKVDILWDYICDNPETNTTKIGKVICAKYASQRNSVIDDLRIMAGEKGKLLIERKDGAARYYSIVDDYIGYIKANKGKTSLEDMEREFGKGIKTILESDPTVDKGVNDNYFIK